MDEGVTWRRGRVFPPSSQMIPDAWPPGRWENDMNKLANPAPLGLAGFALTTWMLSMVNAGWYSAASVPLASRPSSTLQAGQAKRSEGGWFGRENPGSIRYRRSRLMGSVFRADGSAFDAARCGNAWHEALMVTGHAPQPARALQARFSHKQMSISRPRHAA